MDPHQRKKYGSPSDRGFGHSDQRTVKCAHIAVQLAESSVDEVERMVLEAIAAHLEAEAMTVE